jgi:DNA primase
LSEHEPLRPLSDSQREALEEAVSSYQAALTRDAARYLHGRGIDQATASTFRLGVVREPFPGHSRFVGFLAIPYLDANGKPLTVRFRCLQSHDHRSSGHGKYMSIPEDPARVFNIPAIHQAKDEIHVCEGEIDAITLNMIGLPAVAIPGAQGWRPHHRRMLAGFSRVWVWGDPDDAGAQFTQKVTASLRQAKGVRLHDDVNATYMAGGAESLFSLIERKEAA